MATREEMGKILAEARKAMSKTQKQLSQLTGINKSTLSAIENGRFTGSLDIFERYIDALGLEINLVTKEHKFPDWDQIETIFADDV